jgi:tetratricopeptide (TPR) repeat protein
MTDRKPFAAAHLSEIERIPGAEGGFSTTPVRLRFGIGSFGVNAYTAAKAGDEVIEEHDELGPGAGRHEELYFVAAGHAGFAIDGAEVDAPAGTFVFVADPAARRRARAEADETTVLVVGGTVGRAFEPSPWESWLAAFPFYAREEWPPALEIMRAALERHPDNANVLYNLACVEALAGEREAALEHVRRAAELDARTPEWARSDPDLDPIRDAPGFPGS